jgi:hypothetical protein
VYVRLLREGSIGRALALLGGVIAEGALIASLTMMTFAGGLGPGSWISFLSPLAVILAAGLLIFSARSAFHDFQGEWLRPGLCIIGGLILCLMQLTPKVGYHVIAPHCDQQSRENAAPIIAAVEAYYVEHGEYPDELESLVPAYLPQLPTPACRWLDAGETHPFDLEYCTPEVTLLTVSLADDYGDQRYNFATGNWSSISFLDGNCNFLP